MKHLFPAVALLILVAGCSGSGGDPVEDTALGVDTSSVDSTVASVVRNYAGSASYGDLVVFSVDRAAGVCEVVNETTTQTSTVNISVMDDENMAGVLQVVSGEDRFYAVELTDKLIAANFETGNPSNTISFGVAGDTDNTMHASNIPGDYVYIHISNAEVNGSGDIREWGLLSIIDDGTFQVKAYATDMGTGELTPMAPEAWAGEFPVEEPDIVGTWAVDQADPVRINVGIDGSGASLTGYAYAPDPNAIFVLDMGTGNGFILAMKVLPTVTIANLYGSYKFINVWNDSMGAGRSAGRADIASDGTGTFGHVDTDGGYSSGAFDPIQQCPHIQNMFYTTSVETDDEYTVTLKHYFVLLPYAYMGINFRTDGGFRFVGYSIGARID